MKITLNKQRVPVSTEAGRPNKYPFADMKVGDSFTIKAINYSALNSAKSWAARNNPDWDFKASFVDGKITVWRIK